jgi:hypothetical protein
VYNRVVELGPLLKGCAVLLGTYGVVVALSAVFGSGGHQQSRTAPHSAPRITATVGTTTVDVTQTTGRSLPSTTAEAPDAESARPPAQRFRRRVENDIRSKFPEAEHASCYPQADNELVCHIRVAPTPSVPTESFITVSISVDASGNWDPIGG